MFLLPLIALGFCLGLLTASSLLGAVVATAGIALSRALPRFRAARAPALAILLGSLLAAARPVSPLLSLFPGESPLLRVEGTIAKGPDLPGPGTPSLLLDVERIGKMPIEGRVRMLLPEGAPESGPGDRILVTGRLLRPRRAENPGEADPRARARANGISHLLPVRSAEAIRIADPAPPWHPLRLVHRARRSLNAGISALGSPETRDFLACLLLGRRDRVDPRLTDAFRRSGTIHFLAISGLHVGILAGLAWLLLRPLPLPASLRAVLVAGAALGYAAVTGLRPPAARAAFLVSLAALAPLLRRRPRPVHLLSGAAIAILATDPPAVREVGFQLSFVAVLSILLLAKPIEEGLFARRKLLDRFSVPRSAPWPIRFLRRYARKSVPVSLAAWIGTSPIILSRFGMISLLVVPANLLVFPFVFLLVPLGLLSAATGLEEPTGLLVRGLCRTVKILADLPACALCPPSPPALAVGAYYALLLLLCARRRRVGRPRCLLLLGLLAALTCSGFARQGPPRDTRLTVLSVGHGLATVFQTREGGTLVYDVGALRPRIFQRSILPWLRHRGIRTVDHLVLSHEDQDHTSGAPDLLRSIPVRRFHPPDSLTAGVRLSLEGAIVEVLWPPAAAGLSDNDRSAVLSIRAEGLSVLLTGDIEAEGIRGLLASGRDLGADVLVLPHHGAPQELAGALVDAVRPRVLIASDGARDELDPAYAGAVRTSESGAITVTAGGRLETFR